MIVRVPLTTIATGVESVPPELTVPLVAVPEPAPLSAVTV